MDNFNTNAPNQSNSGYTFNTPYTNNPYTNNQGNQYLPKNKGKIPSIILWVTYGITLIIICLVGLDALILEENIGIAIGYTMATMGVCHILLSVLYLILGGFQLYAIIKKRANSFVIFSFIINIVIFGLGWLDFLITVMLTALYYA